MTLKFLVLVLLPLQVFAQSVSLEKEMGDFSRAVSFCVLPGGVRYVLDGETAVLCKLDSSGSILKQAGGFGWDAGLFDEPVSLSATPLRVLVADKNNHRIQQFDRELILTGILSPESRIPGGEFKYPLGCAYSEPGDLLIIDGFNRRILKYNMYGNFEMEFGGIDKGRYALETPTKIRQLPERQSAVLDGGTIKVYDYFGNGVSIIALPSPATDFAFYGNTVFFARDSSVFLFGPGENNDSREQPLLVAEQPISEIQISGDRLFVLTQKRILDYVIHASGDK